MIPREILKKIRQIELRTNRIVTETLAGFSFQSPPQFRRIPRAMPDSENFNFAMLRIDGEVNRVRPWRWNFGFPGSGSGAKKSFRLVCEGVQHFSKRDVQAMTDSWLALVIKYHGFMPVPFSVSLDYD